ncbi:MAG: SRPBCC family protein [Syntrophobacteraceae bacterium]
MTESEFVYVTYIKTTPDKLWHALTNPEFMKQYWLGVHCESEWKPGSTWKMVSETGQITDMGEILESDPPRRLVIKWRHEWRAELKEEGYSHCMFEIEPADNSTKLTVTHRIDRKPSKFIEAVSGGWPKILSNLKSLLETGQIVTETRCAQPDTKG